MWQNHKKPSVGDIYYANLPYQENVQSGKRPVIISQNDIGNLYSPTVHVIPLTSKLRKAKSQATHAVVLASESTGLSTDSVALVEDQRPISVNCLLKWMGRLNVDDEDRLMKAFKIQFPFAGG